MPNFLDKIANLLGNGEHTNDIPVDDWRDLYKDDDDSCLQLLAGVNKTR